MSQTTPPSPTHDAAGLRTITAGELQQLWGGAFSPRLLQRIADLGLQYRPLSGPERDDALLKIVNAVCDPPPAAGAHRLAQWERGWGENLQAFMQTRSLEAVIPRYFGKHQVVRWRGELVQPVTPAFEFHILTLLVEWALENYLSEAGTLCELGCGPGYHLLRARPLFPDKPLVGLDWAESSQALLAQVVQAGAAANLRGHRFNFFEPDEQLPIGPDWGLYSVAALEQVGERHEALLQYLLRKRPRICVHLEPLDEVLNPACLLDRLSILYARRRNYLRGLVPRLRELEQAGRLRILAVQRTWTGSLFIEGHSLLVWTPV